MVPGGSGGGGENCKRNVMLGGGGEGCGGGGDGGGGGAPFGHRAVMLNPSFTGPYTVLVVDTLNDGNVPSSLFAPASTGFIRKVSNGTIRSADA
mmetsp:Transcript_16018/g.39008  ORF Transcript_16018/g.39008 Transcript_16018/m.39008 type:complete len:94 (+) Transcript_16018:2344-2625(+)